MAKLQRVTSLTLHLREKTGTTGANALRRIGRIPAVLYGHGGPVPVAVDARALSDLIATGGQSHIVDATIDGRQDTVLLRDVQRDPISRRVIAADFQRVSQSEAVYATVPIVTTGVAPGVKDGGGVLDVVTHALEIKGPAGSLPEELTLDVSALDVGDHIAAHDVALPAGFTLVTGGETIVVSVETTRATAGEGAGLEETPAVATPAENG